MQLIIQIAPLLVLLVVAFGCGCALDSATTYRGAGMSLRAKNSLKNIPSSGRPEKAPTICGQGKSRESHVRRVLCAPSETSDV